MELRHQSLDSSIVKRERLAQAIRQDRLFRWLYHAHLIPLRVNANRSGRRLNEDHLIRVAGAWIDHQTRSLEFSAKDFVKRLYVLLWTHRLISKRNAELMIFVVDQ